MIESLMNRTVELVARGEADDFDNRQTVTSTTTTRGALQQRRADEPGDQGELSDTGWILFLPAGTVLDGSDVVQIDGAEYELVGDPWHVIDEATGREHHVEAALRQTASAIDEAGGS